MAVPAGRVGTGGGFVEFFHESWRLTSSSSKESCRPTSKEKPEEVRGRCGGSSGGAGYAPISDSQESVGAVMRARRARFTSLGGECSGALSGGGVSRSRGSPSKDQVRGSPGEARPDRLGPRRLGRGPRRRGAREQRKTEAAQRRAPLQGPRLGLGRDDRELGAAGLDGRRGFGVHSGLTGGGGSSFDGLFPGASGAAPSPALFRLFPGAAGAPAAGMGRGCALAVEATSGRLPRQPKVTVLSRQRLPPKDDI